MTEKTETQPMTFWDHIAELRKRVLRSLLFITLAAIAGFALSDVAQKFMIQPFIEFVPLPHSPLSQLP